MKFQSQTRRLLPRNLRLGLIDSEDLRVSIADATLASPQRRSMPSAVRPSMSFNRRRDACFPATQEYGD